MKRIGITINPIAGMGGSVGLKGTDGPEILQTALSRGAIPQAETRALEALSQLRPMLKELQFIAGKGAMGENTVRSLSADVDVRALDHVSEDRLKCTREDTLRIAKQMLNEHVDLLMFCGGDGTARDLLDSIGKNLPVLGIPAGVKMHSAVFAITPHAAGQLARHHLESGLELHEAEVMDVDEEAYRAGRLAVKLYGYMLVPQEPFLLQGSKAVMPATLDEHENVEAIARQIVEEMEPDTLYILGAGTTVKAIADQLKQPKTLLGVDVLKAGRLVKADAAESDLIRLIEGEKKVTIIVSPIGHQGHIFGRGTQQITPKILRKMGKSSVIVIASQSKIRDLQCLYVDTGDPEVDAMFRGYIRVTIDYRLWRMVPVK